MPLKPSNLAIRKKISAFLCSAFCTLALLAPLVSFAFQENQQTMEFNQYSGEVKDQSSNKSLVFATLAIEGTNISTITNTEGNFLLKVPKEFIHKNVVI